MSFPDAVGPPSVSRVARLNNKADKGECMRCGECCMVLHLESISDEEAERLGKEFCYRYHADPDRWGIKRVPRSWAPEWATEGVCVFLNPGPDGFRCMARDERPAMCYDFKCVFEVWAPKMDYKVMQNRVSAAWGDMSEAQQNESTSELSKMRIEARVY